MTLGSFGFIYLLTGLEGRKVFVSSLSIVNMVFDFLRNGTSKSVKSKVHVQNFACKFCISPISWGPEMDSSLKFFCHLRSIAEPFFTLV